MEDRKGKQRGEKGEEDWSGEGKGENPQKHFINAATQLIAFIKSR